MLTSVIADKSCQILLSLLALFMKITIQIKQNSGTECQGWNTGCIGLRPSYLSPDIWASSKIIHLK